LTMLVAGNVALGRRKLLLRRVWRATMVDDVASIISCMTQWLYLATPTE